MVDAAMFTSPMARKKPVEARYNPNTYRVISYDAEQAVPNRIVEINGFPRSNVIGQAPPPDVKDHRKNRPNATNVGFLSQDVKLLNEPVCDVYTKKTRHEQNAWWPHQVSEDKLKQPSHPLDSTFRQDFQFRGANVPRNTRHSSNPNKKPALGSVPVNLMRERDGKQRFWKEGISYEHQYNCRLDPQYPIRSKRHGAFVWDQFPAAEVDRMLHHYNIVADKNEQTSSNHGSAKPGKSPQNAGDSCVQSKPPSAEKPAKSAQTPTNGGASKQDSLVNTVQGSPNPEPNGQLHLPSIF